MPGSIVDSSYPRPMLTADVVVFVSAKEAMRILLIRRANPPFAGCWALPGGFVDEGERVTEAASRELAEETGLHMEELELLGVYDTPGRDPRGWTVSVVYLSFANSELIVIGDDDASEARWFATDDLPELAFDHAAILADAIARVS